VRLFVAADISDSTRQAMRRARAAIERAIAAARTPPRIAWVRDDVAHVTLRFIGEVSDDDAQRIAAALTPPLDVAPFEVEWSQVGVFPPGRGGLRQPRTIWLGASRGADALVALAAAVDDRLRPLVPSDDRRHTPHLTVARVKMPGKGLAWADVLDAARPEPTTSTVTHVTLYRSQLSSRGPTYTAICTADFRVEGSKI
jgi:RNA 2',3'-cyclic 3'-phosphodiesterase